MEEGFVVNSAVSSQIPPPANFLSLKGLNKIKNSPNASFFHGSADAMVAASSFIALDISTAIKEDQTTRHAGRWLASCVEELIQEAEEEAWSRQLCRVTGNKAQAAAFGRIIAPRKRPDRLLYFSSRVLHYGADKASGGMRAAVEQCQRYARYGSFARLRSYQSASFITLHAAAGSRVRIGSHTRRNASAWHEEFDCCHVEQRALLVICVTNLLRYWASLPLSGAAA